MPRAGLWWRLRIAAVVKFRIQQSVAEAYFPAGAEVKVTFKQIEDGSSGVEADHQGRSEG